MNTRSIDRAKMLVLVLSSGFAFACGSLGLDMNATRQASSNGSNGNGSQSTQPGAPGGSNSSTSSSSSSGNGNASSNGNANGTSATKAPDTKPAGPDPNEYIPKVAALVPVYKSSPLTPDDAQKKCDAGNFRACSTLGSWLFYGTRKVTDKKKGEELMRKGCAAGDALGCSMLTNNGIYNYDDPRSKKLIHWACEAKEGYGCWLEADYEKAAKYYQQECDAGETGSCIDLALMYRDGHKGVGSDDAKQFALYKKACAAGNADGCDYLAGAYEEGTSVPQSDSQAKANYTKACNMGSSQGCEDLAKLVEDRKNRGIVIR